MNLPCIPLLFPLLLLNKLPILFKLPLDLQIGLICSDKLLTLLVKVLLPSLSILSLHLTQLLHQMVFLLGDYVDLVPTGLIHLSDLILKKLASFLFLVSHFGV